MNAIDKAIWYIEAHYRERISLGTLAQVAGVSRYHLSRMFCYRVGQPFSRYLRMRRLSRAAIELAAGESDILDLALSLGYGSHEAFSRAFKEHFQQTPEQVRKQGHTQHLDLMEPIRMQTITTASLKEPRFEDTGRLTIAGISRHYPFERVAEIPEQWQSFVPLMARLTRSPKPVTYGVIYNSGHDSFDYLTGVELPKGDAAPENVVRLDLAPQRYAVFAHAGHVAAVRETCEAIWADWLPASGRQVIEAPWFERYGDAFDPQTGEGGLEIWIPVGAGH
ncbi:MAG: AraC family transcriptional regulator [Pseudomonadales bacterium]